MRRASAVIMVIVMGGTVPLLLAQQVPSGPMTLIDVEVTGLETRTLADVLEVSGLSIGFQVTIEEIEAAAQRLNQSALTATVGYGYSYHEDEVIVYFEIEEAQTELEVVFDNFPWFTDEELTKFVAAEVPVFAGRLPEASPLTDRIAGALERALGEIQLLGRVSHRLHEDEASRRRVHLFHTAIELPICNLGLEGEPVAFQGELGKAATPLFAETYSRAGIEAFVNRTLLPVYRRYGYLDATFSWAQGTRAADGTCDGVRVSVPVDAGQVWTWEGMTWTGHQAFETQELEGLISLQPGQVADGIKVDEALAEVRRSYMRQGYIMLRMEPMPSYDAERRSVRYDVRITEGQQYRMGRVRFDGGSSELAEVLRQRWALETGDVYDAGYVNEFLQEARDSAPELFFGIQRISTDATRDEGQLTVDLVVTLE